MGDSVTTGADDVFVLDRGNGPLVFDRGAAALTRGGEEIHLTNTEFRVLSVLADNAGRVLSRSALLEHVWERGFFGASAAGAASPSRRLTAGTTRPSGRCSRRSKSLFASI